MISYEENGVRVLEPENGLWLTNSKTYSQKVYLGKNASANEWAETEWDGTYSEEDEELTDSEALDIILGVSE